MKNAEAPDMVVFPARKNDRAFQSKSVLSIDSRVVNSSHNRTNLYNLPSDKVESNLQSQLVENASAEGGTNEQKLWQEF